MPDRKQLLTRIGVSVIGLYLGGGLLFAIFSCPHRYTREMAHSAGCLSNVKQISLAMLMYSSDYEDRLPPLNRWNKYMKPSSYLICPSAESKKVPCYAVNSRLREVSLNDLKNPDRVVFVFESEPGYNRVGGPELFPLKTRHEGIENMSFVDGHAKHIPKLSGRYRKFEDIPYLKSLPLNNR